MIRTIPASPLDPDPLGYDAVRKTWAVGFEDRLVLAERPKGEPTKDTLKLTESDIPKAGDNQMLLRTEYLSLDPYMRGRMSDEPSYADPVKIGEVMIGGTVAEVVESNIDGFEKGDYVLCGNGWQDYAVSDGKGLTNLGKSPSHPQLFCHVTHMRGGEGGFLKGL